MPSVFLTGITGFVGSHLAEYYLDKGWEVHGLVRWRSPLDNIRKILPRVKLHYGDLRDLASLLPIFSAWPFERVHHLAAQSYVDTSFTAPADTLITNAIGTVNLLDAIRFVYRYGEKNAPRIHICSSSEVYGQVKPGDVPITEDCPLRPASPYAVSKVAEDMLGLQYWLSYGMPIVRTRMFTHTGPRRGPVFAESSFAQQMARIEAGLQAPVVKHGNLDSIRTLCDVRDACRAYDLLLEKCPAGEVYNIGGAETMTVGEILQVLAGLSRGITTFAQDPARLRPSDVTLQIPDVSKFKKATGWKPQIPAKDTLKNLLDWHHEQVRRETA